MLLIKFRCPGQTRDQWNQNRCVRGELRASVFNDPQVIPVCSQSEMQRLWEQQGWGVLSLSKSLTPKPQFLHLKNGNKTCASLLIKQSKLRVIKTQFYMGPGTCSKLPFCWVELGSGTEDIRAPITPRPTPAVWAQGPPTSCCSDPSKLMSPALSPQGAWLLSTG